MDSVKLIECPRDAWQGLPGFIPTGRKVEYLRGLIAAGFRHIDAVSFVSPKAVPQMADSEQVLAQLGPRPYVYFAHSYYVPETDVTAASCTYTLPYTAVLENGNVYGVQFHPEKSGPTGLAIVRNFVEL